MAKFICLTLADGDNQYVDADLVAYVGRRATDPGKTVVITDSGLQFSCGEAPDEVMALIKATGADVYEFGEDEDEGEDSE